MRVGPARALRRVLHWTVPHSFRHSPSFRVQSKSCGEMLHLGRWQGFCERVGDHVISGAIYEAKGALLDDPANEVVVHVDVLGV